uniref:IQ motif containing K n=1 Tax=Dromaius novaehollandiae TaxID=8790 RepID=A0A8C4PCB3_DRONO
MLCFFLLSEYEAEQPTFPDGYESKQESVSLEAGILQPLCMEQFYTASAANTVGQQFLSICEATTSSEPPDPKTCSPREYLEYYIFPILLPGMAELLHQAKKEKCFEVRCDPEVQELREWQKQLREDKNVIKNLKEFWMKQEAKVGSKLEDSEEPTPNHSRFLLVLSPPPPQNTEVMD